ncbi:MAG: hypothetical protein NBKEAIPA_02353 [Nitrospirae bacterium]|nr:MAG: hypothetical protein UZ03_NOB001002291 [Nitrospira sp. OLB3]MBV6470438.1 hypothetical protein [Nitrospirota bacterium]MCE7965858.1 DUF4157 domain-containing protein [Nitrospira sp. NTP2]RIK60398.1 MAG: hypothetical protein DCC63_04825 [Nitrospira sp.]
MRTFAQNQPQQPVSSSFARPNTTTPGCVHHEHPVLYVQRAMGNQAVQRMLQTHVEEPTSGLTGTASPCFGHDFSRISIHPHAVGAIQTKLQISKPGDEYEQEADRTSEQVMRMPEPQLQRACDCGGTCPQCQAEGHKLLQTKHVETGDLGQTAAPPILHDVLRSPGQSLDPATRNFMESRFRYDFSSVRVHSDEMAAESARALHALGYTVGRDIVFGPGQYAPETPTGRQLLAHELTHVVQQEALPSLAATVQRQTDPMQQHMDDMDMEMERKYANSGAPKAQSCGRPSWCPAGFCSPYTSEKLAEYYRSKRAWWLLAGISAVVDSRVVPFWKEYLWGGSAAKNLTADFGKDFSNSLTTKKTTTFLTNELKKSLAAKPLTVSTTASLDIATLIPTAIATLNDPASPDRMNFSAPRDIPGNLAGDIGSNQTTCPAGAQPSRFNDERRVSGTVEVARKSGSEIVVTPLISYTVKDTVDLCPGDCGSPAEQIATVPLSQFEATGISGDVPFTVDFPAPSLGSFTISAPPPTSPAPIPAPASKKPSK